VWSKFFENALKVRGPIAPSDTDKRSGVVANSLNREFESRQGAGKDKDRAKWKPLPSRAEYESLLEKALADDPGQERSLKKEKENKKKMTSQSRPSSRSNSEAKRRLGDDEYEAEEEEEEEEMGEGAVGDEAKASSRGPESLEGHATEQEKELARAEALNSALLGAAALGDMQAVRLRLCSTSKHNMFLRFLLLSFFFLFSFPSSAFAF
jgi:hypothetical protein